LAFQERKESWIFEELRAHADIQLHPPIGQDAIIFDVLLWILLNCLNKSTKVQQMLAWGK